MNIIKHASSLANYYVHSTFYCIMISAQLHMAMKLDGEWCINRPSLDPL